MGIFNASGVDVQDLINVVIASIQRWFLIRPYHGGHDLKVGFLFIFGLLG